MKITVSRFIRILIAAVLWCVVICSSSCIATRMIGKAEKEQEYAYYKNKDVFVQATGTISFIKYLEDSDTLSLSFSALSPRFEYNGAAFVIEGENYNIVMANGIKDNIEIGDAIRFMAAPRYFGDGYCIPIVEIQLDGEELLDFNQGHANLLKQLKN